MPKFVTLGLTAFLLSVSSLSYAQGPSSTGAMFDLPSAADLKAITDERIDVVKAALQLTPEQAKLWPAVEAAIRARADARYARLTKLAARVSDHRDFNAIDIMRGRAEALTQKAAALTKLVEVWQPLHASLDDAQKMRLRVLAHFVLREMRDDTDNRRMEIGLDDDGPLEFETMAVRLITR